MGQQGSGLILLLNHNVYNILCLYSRHISTVQTDQKKKYFNCAIPDVFPFSTSPDPALGEADRDSI